MRPMLPASNRYRRQPGTGRGPWSSTPRSWPCRRPREPLRLGRLLCDRAPLALLSRRTRLLDLALYDGDELGRHLIEVGLQLRKRLGRACERLQFLVESVDRVLALL